MDNISIGGKFPIDFKKFNIKFKVINFVNYFN